MQRLTSCVSRLTSNGSVPRQLLPAYQQTGQSCDFSSSQAIEKDQSDRQADDSRSSTAQRRKQDSTSDPVEEFVADPSAAEKEQDDDQEADSVEALRAHHIPQSSVGNPDDDVPGHGGKA